MSEKRADLGNSRRKSPGEDEGRARAARSFFATILCVLGILLSLGVLVATVLLGGSFGVVSAGAVGALLGVAGYSLGAGRLATATIIISILSLFLGLAASQNLIPGLGPSDRGLPSEEPDAQRPGS